MAISCSPSDLLNSARCFESCGGDPMAIRNFLLLQFVPCVPAGSPPGTPPVVGCNAPAAPANLEVTPVANNPGSTTIAIDWTQPASNPPVTTNNYAIIWSVPRGPINFAVIPGTQLSYTITGLTPSTDYSIVVRAIHGACASSSSVLHTSTTSGSVTPAAVLDWVNRVQINGGPKPTDPTIAAVTTWYNGLVADGIDSLIISASFFAPDSTIAALTPFFKVSGIDPYTVSGGQAITLAGMPANVAVGNIITGCDPSVVFSTSDMGIVGYANQVGGNPNFSFGGGNGANCAEIFGTSNGNYLIASYSAWAITLSAVAVFNLGDYLWIAASRTGVAALDGYVANGNNAWANHGSSAAASGAPPGSGGGINSLGWASSGVCAGNNGFSNISFMAITHGMTSAQGKALFNRTQTLRQAFGGGFT